MGIYEGTQRALKLTGAAFDTTRERFTTLGKQAKAFGAGVKAATEFERSEVISWIIRISYRPMTRRESR
jgi:hypothetical protein